MILPLTAHVKISQNIASILYNHVTKRKDVAIKNIKTAFPEKSSETINKILINSYKFFSFNFIQFLSFPKSTKSINIKIVGQDLMDEALLKNKGVIFISSHIGPWEILGYWLGVNGYQLRGIAQKQKNKGSNKFFQKKRELSGIKHIFRKTDLKILYNVLEENKILGLVSDQDAKNKGIFIKFFNKYASTPKGAAKFYLNTRAPMIYGVCIQTGFQNYKIEFVPVKPKEESIKNITQEYTNILEGFIQRYPEQYFWFHNRWKTKI